MPIPLPNLDDRRWRDLVEEGRALIPLHAPEWTDHNIHDPGVTLIELLAWVAEMDLYRLNRIPELHLQKFLALAGMRPEPPRAAQTVLRVDIKTGITPIVLPGGVEFASADVFGEQTPFRTLEDLTALPVKLKALQSKDERGWRDLSALLQRGELIDVFGSNPAPGAAFYLGFAEALPQNVPVSLFFVFSGAHAKEAERRRLLDEATDRRRVCRPDDVLLSCPEESSRACVNQVEKKRAHHSVSTVWEFLGDNGFWQPLDARTRQVIDETRNFTLDGRVVVTLPKAMGKIGLGDVGTALYYLRCRFTAGAYDAAPKLQKLLVNGVRAEQAVAVGVTEWIIARGAIVIGEAPTPGERVGIEPQFNEAGDIIRIAFVDNSETIPQFVLLNYLAATPTQPGKLTIEAEALGVGNGRPAQQFQLSQMPVIEKDFLLFSVEEGGLRFWTQRDDFDASSRGDAHFRLDAVAGKTRFGDGENGRVVENGVAVYAVYHSTRAEAGNVESEPEQVFADRVTTWTISPGASVEGEKPEPGKLKGIQPQFNAAGEIIHIVFSSAAVSTAKFLVLAYQAATEVEAGSLTIDIEFLGNGAGKPKQQLMLSQKPVQEKDFYLFTIENGALRSWTRRENFNNSRKTDAHFLLDATAGRVSFGDGENGSVIPEGIAVFALYHPVRIFELLDSPHNRALLRDDFEVINARLRAGHPVPSDRGSAAETVAQAVGRTLLAVQEPQRAVTSEDYKALALATLGAQIARVDARANLHPHFPCFKALGIITVIIVPYLPVDRPTPSPGLRRTVAAYLSRRRVIGTRVEVVGPQYVEVVVRAEVKACPGVNKTNLQQNISSNLNRFFHPLSGGADRDGWPFGRDVYRSEVLQVIDETPGVDHVLSLSLITDSGEPQCSNVCLGPFGLVAAGKHEILVG